MGVRELAMYKQIVKSESKYLGAYLKRSHDHVPLKKKSGTECKVIHEELRIMLVTYEEVFHMTSHRFLKFSFLSE
jgi:hypothetical protein